MTTAEQRYMSADEFRRCVDKLHRHVNDLFFRIIEAERGLDGVRDQAEQALFAAIEELADLNAVADCMDADEENAAAAKAKGNVIPIRDEPGPYAGGPST